MTGYGVAKMPENRTETAGERYERDMVSTMFAPFARNLVARVDMQGSMRVADIGCGTGIVARLIGEKLDGSSTLIGVDINAGILAVAKAASAKLTCRCEWHEASADTLPIADASLDLVVSQHAFMFFPDQPAAAREMFRVLRPDGRLYINVWRHYNHQPHYVAFIDGLRRYVGERAGDLMQGAFVYETEAQIRQPIADGGFQRVEVETVILDARYPSAENSAG